MKITTGFLYKTFINDMNKHIEEMFKYQKQLSTGKRILSPSDDPVAISRIVKYNTEISALIEYARVIDVAKIYNSSIETAINDLKNMIIKAKEHSVNGSTDTLSATNRVALAQEVDTLIQRSIETINTKVSGRYVFGGYKADNPPVNTSTGIYESDTNLQYLDISFFLDVAVNLPATEFFTYQVDASDPYRDIKVFTPYNQTVTILGTQLHDVDPFSALLMRQPSTGAINDPLVTVTANGGTLSIKLGENESISVTISQGSSLNDIKDAINSQAGNYVKAWVVNVKKNPTDPDDYRIVINSVPNGKSDKIRINVNTQDNPDTGLNLLSYNPEAGFSAMSLEGNINGYNYITDPNDPNYYSFNNNYLNENYYIRALHFLKVALLNNDQGRIQKAVDYFDKIAEKLYRQQSIIGARLNKIETTTYYNLELKTNTNQSLSNDQDADALEAISKLNQRMTVLQAMRVTLTNFFGSNLFDFLK
ncbi:MAG: flagellar hook-associated protein FlgL [Thermodesulfovibrio sp.]|nr:flagellar hook-associated protein FlgL [Thermodesulfovibrio sp.]MCX7724491.1 flagellar hook-associated protein FlgL [Thermodesulfovibrio sp.]MDW7971685.1 flagellar hook-associated protein FlgL [Thermodesulfovibrio sp.]